MEKIHFDFSTEGHFLKSWITLKIISQVVVNQSGRILSWVLPTCRNGNIDLIFRRLPDPILIHSCLSRIHAVGNHEWTRINTNGPAVERLWATTYEIIFRVIQLLRKCPSGEKSKWIFSNQISLSIVDRPSGSRVSHVASRGT